MSFAAAPFEADQFTAVLSDARMRARAASAGSQRRRIAGLEALHKAGAMPDMETQQKLLKFGFRFGRDGAHSARTIMLDDLEVLLEQVRVERPTHDDFEHAIVEQNCLSKQSGRSRELTLKYLTTLYGLDVSIPIFRVMLNFWRREREGRALLAALCALPRDPILRESFEWIQDVPVGAKVLRSATEEKLNLAFPDRYSPASVKSLSQNVNGTWTRTGHLKGRNIKIRQRAKPTPAATAFALYLSYITGARGENLFKTDFCSVLDAPAAELMETAEAAAKRGWIVFKRLGNVVEAQFPNLITEEERRILDE